MTKTFETKNIVMIYSESDIDKLMEVLREGKSVGFEIDASVEREEHFRLMNEINERYKSLYANTNMKSARVA